MEEDILYQNQELLCETNNLPLFAPKECHHHVRWGQPGQYDDKPTVFGDMLEYKYGEDAIEESMKLVTSCPVCCKSWCD